MPDVFVGLGSNADPAQSLRAAVAALEERFRTLGCSSVYRSPAAGGPAPDYLNMAVSFTTEWGVASLRKQLAEIETALGRSRDDRAICRLDLDLLLYGVRVDAMQRLPRPGAFTLPFVLRPLAELAPQLVHPLTGERCGDLWSAVASGSVLENLGRIQSLG